jgi:hypothetical protein
MNRLLRRKPSVSVVHNSLDVSTGINGDVNDLHTAAAVPIPKSTPTPKPKKEKKEKKAKSEQVFYNSRGGGGIRKKPAVAPGKSSGARVINACSRDTWWKGCRRRVR